ncbi:MAG: FAD:protein FMN transferase [Planctomycetia bacterium]|nr:FAD:protein FMN transferase [Planctomycetia bacterium]
MFHHNSIYTFRSDINYTFLGFFIFFFILIFLSAGKTAAQNPGRENTKAFRGQTMGTTWKVVLVTDSSSIQDTDIQSVLDSVDQCMSTWKPDSELSRINATEDISLDISLSPQLAKVLITAQEISKQTNGAYDITVGPLVNLWNFGPGGEYEKAVTPPKEEMLTAVREKCGFSAIQVRTHEDGTYKLHRKKTGLYLDLSSIAKGYAVDEVAHFLTQRGFTRFMVEVGGEVRVKGRNANGNPWNIGIENPTAGEFSLYGSVKMEDGALASSGGYRNFRKLSTGETVSHILDPRTGFPVTHHVLATSVLAPSCMEADAWATAIMVLGPRETEKLIAEKQIPELQLLFLTWDEKGDRMSPQNVLAYNHNFPIITLSQTLDAPQLTDKKDQYNLNRLFQFLLPFLAFLCFFVGIGLNQLLGRRRMMCSCKTAKAMEVERQNLIKTIRPKDEEHFQ